MVARVTISCFDDDGQAAAGVRLGEVREVPSPVVQELQADGRVPVVVLRLRDLLDVVRREALAPVLPDQRPQAPRAVRGRGVSRSRHLAEGEPVHLHQRATGIGAQGIEAAQGLAGVLDEPAPGLGLFGAEIEPRAWPPASAEM